MVDRPGVHVRLRRAERFEARGLHGERALRFAQACVQGWGLEKVGCAIEVLAAPRSHVGLGSGTQLALAVAAGMRHLFRERADEGPHEFEIHPTDDEWLFDTPDALELAKAVGRGRLTARQIEAARRAMTRHIKRGGRVWIRIFPDKPISQKPAEVRMGNGKGNPEYYVAEIQPGKVLYEMDGVDETLAREAFRLAAAKLPLQTVFVTRHVGV